ncbi:MAG: arginyltransferase [Sphingomonadales bacterium]
MTDQSFQFPRFYVTAPSPCPYLENREERKVFTELDGPDATELNEALGRVGFRRSQAVAYRPACDGCNACISVRVLAGEFHPSRNMKRVLKANRDVEVSAMDACATHEQYFVLQKYLMLRHAEGGMTRMDEFEYSEMLETSPVTTTVVEYRVKASSRDRGEPAQLLGVALTDALSDGLSMVYSFFDPDEAARSLGTFIILDHIQRARKAGLPHVYLGYWVEGSAKMDYKRRFKPIEMLGSMGWARLEPGN